MKLRLKQIQEKALAEIGKATAADALESVRVRYLGKKGELTAILRGMGALSAEDRPIMGQMANEVRAAIEKALQQAAEAVERHAFEARMASEAIDVTVPGKKLALGKKHPLNIVLDELSDIFIGMGFEVLDGPEVEDEKYNFTKLNADEGHPSRDWSDTFYFDENSKILLRSQTSPSRWNRSMP